MNAPVTIGKGSTLLTAAGTFVRRDSARGIEAADRVASDAQVPNGWARITVA